MFIVQATDQEWQKNKFLWRHNQKEQKEKDKEVLVPIL